MISKLRYDLKNNFETFAGSFISTILFIYIYIFLGSNVLDSNYTLVPKIIALLVCYSLRPKINKINIIKKINFGFNWYLIGIFFCFSLIIVFEYLIFQKLSKTTITFLISIYIYECFYFYKSISDNEKLNSYLFLFFVEAQITNLILFKVYWIYITSSFLITLLFILSTIILKNINVKIKWHINWYFQSLILLLSFISLLFIIKLYPNLKTEILFLIIIIKIYILQKDLFLNGQSKILQINNFFWFWFTKLKSLLIIIFLSFLDTLILNYNVIYVIISNIFFWSIFQTITTKSNENDSSQEYFIIIPVILNILFISFYQYINSIMYLIFWLLSIFLIISEMGFQKIATKIFFNSSFIAIIMITILFVTKFIKNNYFNEYLIITALIFTHEIIHIISMTIYKKKIDIIKDKKHYFLPQVHFKSEIKNKVIILAPTFLILGMLMLLMVLGFKNIEYLLLLESLNFIPIKGSDGNLLIKKS